MALYDVFANTYYISGKKVTCMRLQSSFVMWGGFMDIVGETGALYSVLFVVASQPRGVEPLVYSASILAGHGVRGGVWFGYSGR